MGDDYIPGNKCRLSTAGMKILSRIAVAHRLFDVCWSATTLNNVFKSAFFYILLKNNNKQIVSDWCGK